MTIEQSRARLAARIQELIDESGVSLAAIPRDRQERLLATLTDGLLVSLDQMLDDIDDRPAPAATPSGDEEQVLWEGRPFLSLLSHYTVTNQRIRIRHGLLSRTTDDIELARLQDVDITQKMTERMVNVGDITLRSANKSDPVVVLQNVHDPESVHEIIRRARLEARRRLGVRFREEV